MLLSFVCWCKSRLQPDSFISQYTHICGRYSLLSLAFVLCSYIGYTQSEHSDVRKTVQRLVQGGGYQTAITLLEQQLPVICNDSSGLFEALINLYLFQKDWNGIVAAYARHVCKPNEDTTVLSVARFCLSQPREVIAIQDPVHMPFKAAASGTPLVRVKVNGQRYRFWLDTGAGMTVLSSSTASRCGVKRAHAKDAVAIAATGNAVALDPGMIDLFEIDELKVLNHPCIILHKKDLEWRILGIPLIKIDGLIGWNLLQELKVTINNQTDSLSLDTWDTEQVNNRNFFWMGDPLIQCTDGAGDSCLFTIDTGAGSAAVYEPFLAKRSATGAERKDLLIGSAGGIKKVESFEIPMITLTVDSTALTLKKVPLYPHEPNCLFSCDGVIGIQDLEYHTIQFNMRKGYFLVKKYEGN